MRFPPALRTAMLLLAIDSTAAATEVPPPSATDLIAAADRIRNPGQPFRALNTITEYIQGQQRDQLSLSVYAKEVPDTGEYRNLVQYVAPPRDAGKLVLLDGGNMWFYDPDSKASVRISPQQRLLGQAANGDVVTVNLAHDYSGRIVGDEALIDADHQKRDCWHLSLTATTPEAVYNHMDYWIDRSNSQPVKARYYSDSGRLLKVAYFAHERAVLGGIRPTEIVILDGINPNLVTTMELSDYTAETIPDAWFQRDFLSQFRAR